MTRPWSVRPPARVPLTPLDISSLLESLSLLSSPDPPPPLQHPSSTRPSPPPRASLHLSGHRPLRRVHPRQSAPSSSPPPSPVDPLFPAAHRAAAGLHPRGRPPVADAAAGLSPHQRCICHQHRCLRPAATTIDISSPPQSSPTNVSGMNNKSSSSLP